MPDATQSEKLCLPMRLPDKLANVMPNKWQIPQGMGPLKSLFERSR